MTYLEFKDDHDPLKNIKPLAKGTKFYRAERWWFYFQLIISILGIGYITNILFISLEEQNYFSLGFSLLLVLIILYSLAVKIIGIEITKNGIEFIYFFNRKKSVAFEEISDIELRLQRGQVCILKTSNRKIVFQIVSIQEAPQLIKTIVNRSKLKFIESNYSKAIYRRN